MCFDFHLKRLKARLPKLIEPGSQGAEASRIDFVDPPRALGAVRYQSRKLEHFEVLGHRRPTDRKTASQRDDRLRASTKPLENRPASWVSKGRDRSICISHDLP